MTDDTLRAAQPSTEAGRALLDGFAPAPLPDAQELHRRSAQGRRDKLLGGILAIEQEAVALASVPDEGRRCVGKSDDRWLCETHPGGMFSGQYSGGGRCSLARPSAAPALDEKQAEMQRVIEDHARACPFRDDKEDCDLLDTWREYLESLAAEYAASEEPTDER